MTRSLFFSLIAVALFFIGFYGLLIPSHPIRRLLAINIMSSSLFMLLVALAWRTEGAPDPIPHALVLTGLVISISATAFGLALVKQLHRRTTENHPSDRR